MLQATKDLGAKSCEMRQVGDSIAKGFGTRKDKLDMRLPLLTTPDAMLRSFSAKLRSQIKRPLRENPEVLVGRGGLLENFYTVFSRNMRDLGTPVYPKSFFRCVLDNHPEAVIVCVKVAGSPAAAAILMDHGKMLEIPWASTDRRYNRLSVNMLLYWTAIEYAITHGYRVFDFGRSTVGSGPHRFKKQPSHASSQPVLCRRDRRQALPRWLTQQKMASSTL